MKINIEAFNQEEFDSKREDLIKALAGNKFNVEITPKVDQSKSKLDLKAMQQAYGEWLEEYNKMVVSMKKEIKEYLESQYV